MPLTADDVRTVTLVIHTADGQEFQQTEGAINARNTVENLMHYGYWRYEDEQSTRYVVTRVDVDKRLDLLDERLAT